MNRLLGLFLVCIIGVVDCHGSQLLQLRVIRQDAVRVASALRSLFLNHGSPKRVITDNGGEFVSDAFRQLMSEFGVEHRRTRPAHPWTNGRIERVFGTMKRLQRLVAPFFLSTGHVQRFCLDFIRYYNSCRPHQSYWGFTPAEVARDEVCVKPPTRVELFDGLLVVDEFT